MATQLVPLSSAPNQAFTISLDVDGATLIVGLTVRYSEIAGYWVLSISDNAGTLLVDSIPLICGSYPAANILQQHVYLGIGSAYVINASGVADDYPSKNNLGSDFVLIWSDTPTQ